VTSAATCTTDGVKTYTCAACGDSYTEVISATGHNHTAVVTEPSCTTGGYTTYTCSVCGDTYVADEVVALGHTKGEVVVENPVDATCTEAGSYDNVVYCTVCKAELSREKVTTDQLGHTAATKEENRVEATCGEAGSYDEVTYCSVCQKESKRETIEIPATGKHSYGEYVSLGEVETAECKVCGATDSKIVEVGEADGVITVTPNVTDTSANVTVNTGALEKVVETTKPLFLSSDLLDLSFNTAALKTIEAEKTVSIVVENVTPADVTDRLVYEIHLEIDGTKQESTDFGDGTVTITIPLKQYEPLVGKIVTVQYSPEDRDAEVMESTLDRDGMSVRFETSHFSTYTVLVEDHLDEEHIYEDDVCTICGWQKDDTSGSEGEDPEEPVEPEPLQGSIRLRSATLQLEDEIYIIYKASEDSTAAADPTKYENVVERGVLLYDTAEKATAREPGMAKAVITLEYDKDEERYIGYTEGIPAKKMAEVQYAVAYMLLDDGTYIFGTKGGEAQTIEYSPRHYCLNKIKDTEATETVKQLCHALMQYGAAAQVQLDNETGPLMNEGFAEVPYDESVLGNSVFSVNTDTVKGIRLRSATMELQGAVSYIVKCTTDETYAGGQLYAEYSYKDKSGSVEFVYNTTDNRLWATIDGVAAMDLDQPLRVRPYYLDENGEKVYGGELVYSGYEYARRALEKDDNPETLKTMARTLAMYIHYADVYSRS